MKNKILITILLCLVFASCGEDRRKQYAEYTACDRWIESVMHENYYWHEDIPNKKLNYFADPDIFFKSLLSSKDASYSYFEDPTDLESLQSYGIQFETFGPYNDTAYAVRVLHVETNSPANDGLLKRGDWIIKRDDEYILKNRIDSLRKGNAIKLTIGEYEEVQDENGVAKPNFKDKKEITIPAARITSDNPVSLGNTYIAGGKRVGYLAYNRFLPGNGENDVTYDNQLRVLSNTFKSNNIDEFILDLRYNTGGSLESAQLLGSILVPQAMLGSPMCYLKYNELQSSRNETKNFSNEVLGSGSNLNLDRLYVITSSKTAAISDVLINSLKPHISEIIIIGQATKGNFTGTHPYSNPLYPNVILHPVDCMIYNSKEEVPQSGFSPASTHALNELSFVETRPIGDPSEVMLYSALYLIANGSMPSFDGTRSMPR